MTDPWDDGVLPILTNQMLGACTIIPLILFVRFLVCSVLALDSTVFNVSKQVVDEALAKKMQSCLVQKVAQGEWVKLLTTKWGP